jgi:hypothetical protein
MGIDLWPFQDIMIRTMMLKDFFLGVCSRGLGKSTLAGVFLPMYAIMNPGVKIGITSPSFRQSRNIFEKIEETINAPRGRFLKQCLKEPPKHNTDAWTMKLGQSEIVALPLGCLEKNSLIKTENGIKKIKNMFPSSGEEKEDWRQSVASVFTRSGKNRCSHVLNAKKQNCLRITTKNGFEIECSYDHKFLVKDSTKDFHWVEAKNIKENNNIYIDQQDTDFVNVENKFGYDVGYKYGLSQCFSKHVDDKILSASRDFAKGYFVAIFESIGKLDEKTGYSISLANEQVAKELQIIFLYYFAIPLFRKDNRLFVGVNYLEKFFEKINFEKSDPFAKFLSISKQNKSNFINKKKNKIWEDFRVVSVEKIGERETYDLRVPAENNYIANGFLTHNSGDKIRGYRFNLLVIDELLFLSEKIINEVLLPFMAVQVDPRERQKVRDAEDYLIKQGKLLEEDRTVFPNNKLIGLTSASYQFEHLYTMFQSYRSLIMDENAKNVSHALMQLSCEVAPPGLYDATNIENAKKTFSKSQYEREYMAAFTGDSSGFFSAKKLYEISLPMGDSPTIKVKGDPSKNYILAIDPNYDSSETSDHFAMCVLELDENSKTACMVHGYAVASCTLQQRMAYIKYLFDNFNIIYLIVDKAAGEKFVKDINDLAILDFKLDFFEAEFEKFDNEEIVLAKQSYSNSGNTRKIVHSQYFSSNWIRYSNETLQGAIENKTIFFGAPTDSENLSKEGIQIKEILFNENEKYGDRPADLLLKLNDFVDHQNTVISMTKNQLALIEVTSNGSTQRFDLPATLKKQSGPDKARKDSYSAFLLANWGKECYFAMQNGIIKKKNRVISKFIV